MDETEKHPWRSLSIALLTILIGIGFFAIYLHQQRDSLGTAILDFYRNWGLGLFLLVAVINLFSGGPGEKDKRGERSLRWTLLILINWGVWTLYGG